jgi:choline dehydrogenase-like flavoprotein
LGVKRQGYYYTLNNFVEQTPNPNSRIRLADERDALGIPLAAVEWRLTDLDKFGIRRAHELIAAEAGRSGFGRLRLELKDAQEVPLEGAAGGYHHMGTTRMHDSPLLGVVDRNAKVYGLENLYVAGSSVFPTSGYINPTMTITALALRLSDHLKERLARLLRVAQPVETQP